MDCNFDKYVVDIICDWVHMLEPIRAEDSDEPPNRMFHNWRCPACNPRQIESKGGLWGEEKKRWELLTNSVDNSPE
jgi:hypothetical protein